MINPYLPQPVKIAEILWETPNTKWFRVKFVDKKVQENFYFWHGQFAMLGLLGFGEAPFDICSNPHKSTEYLEFAIRRAGRLTAALTELAVGDTFWLRGPYGQGWPSFLKLKQKNLLIVAGGLGLVPLKSVIEEAISQSSYAGQIQILFGCKTIKELLFENCYNTWQKKGIKINVALSQEKIKHATVYGANCSFGQVTKLLDKIEVKNNAAFLCGPPVMYRPVLQKLNKLKIADEDIYLSLERRMDCGFGVCQHCACHDLYICKDGPVFKYSKIKDVPNII